jgi:hypothetical protein
VLHGVISERSCSDYVGLENRLAAAETPSKKADGGAEEDSAIVIS